MYDLVYVPLETSACGVQAIARADATWVTTKMILLPNFDCLEKPTHMWHSLAYTYVAHKQ